MLQFTKHYEKNEYYIINFVRLVLECYSKVVNVSSYSKFEFNYDPPNASKFVFSNM